MKLAEAFDVQKGDIVAFVGAGGKTSALVTLGRELASIGWRVLATTSTRIGREQLDWMPGSISYQGEPTPISALLQSKRFVFVYDRIQADKAHGLSPDHINEMLASIEFDICLVEADGARMLPLKAPKPHEPTIPQLATLVIPIMSLSVLGKPLDENNVYNARFLAEHYGYAMGEPVRAAWLARMLQDDAMLLKNIPASAKVIPLLNQVPRSGERYDQANSIAELVMNAQSSRDRERIDRIVSGSVPDADPIHTLHAG